NVDIATYRAEFLSHYYEQARRPLRAYAFGMIDRWARLGAMAPRVANAVSHATGVKHVLRRALSLAREREVPRLARSSFRQWALRRGTPTVGDTRERSAAANGDAEIILWVDTFNNYFYPQTSRAATAPDVPAQRISRASRAWVCAAPACRHRSPPRPLSPQSAHEDDR